MLKKLINIKNVGTFRSSQCHGDTDFRQLTLVHAENGRGKTTLCAILRSVQSGDANLVAERRTLDSSDPPAIDLLFESGRVSFKSGAWTAVRPHIEVFDASFVADNVYSGDAITHDHKRNLCRVVIGVEGVRLARRFDETDAAVKKAAAGLAVAKVTAQQLVPTGLTLDQFVGLPADPELDRRIGDKRRELGLAENAEAIRVRGGLGTLELPQPPPNLTSTLHRTVDGISADAEALVREHIVRHGMQGRGEGWLAEGLGYAQGDGCPLCGQSLAGSRLVGTLAAFFSQAYRDFHQTVARLQEDVARPLGDAVLLRVQKVLAENAAAAEFWRAHATAAVPGLEFEAEVRPVIQGLRDSLAPLVARKLASPLEAVGYSDEAQARIADWKRLRDAVAAYNADVTAFNAAVSAVKAAAGTKNASVIRQEIAALEGRRARHEQKAVDAVSALETARQTKATAEEAKAAAKAELDEYNEEVVSKYEASVNGLLGRIGARFKLAVGIEYVGRTPRAGYVFEIFGRQIDPGSDKSEPGTPCFRNTLSAGDRNTLALAFFIAQLENRADLSGLIVVFDDPFTSLDVFRQNWTCNVIRRLSTTAKQVVVLSHSIEFLRMVASRSVKPLTRTLKIDMHNRVDSRIVPMDLDDAGADLIDRDIIKLRSFHTGDDKDTAGTVRAIRPLLENHIRGVAPDDTPKSDHGWLGTFIGKIQSADAGSVLGSLKPLYDDLDALNSYTSPYAHDSGHAPPINEGELQTMVGLTLSIIGRA